MRIAIKLSGLWLNSDYSWWRKIWYKVYIYIAKNAPSCLLVIYKGSRNTRQPWPCTKQYIPKRALLEWDIGGALICFWCSFISWKFLLGRGSGLTLEYTWSFALRSCGTPPSTFLALWNRIAGLPWNLGSDNMIAGGRVQLLGLIRWLIWNLVEFWDGGVLIACFLARWNRDRLWSLPGSRRRREQ